MYVCMIMYDYVCTYVCMHHVCIMYVCMHVCMYICMYVHMCICAYVRMYVCMYVCNHYMYYMYEAAPDCRNLNPMSARPKLLMLTGGVRGLSKRGRGTYTRDVVIAIAWAALFL